METEQAAIDRHTDRIEKKARRIVDEVLGGNFLASDLSEVLKLRISCDRLTDDDFFRFASVHTARSICSPFGAGKGIDAYFSTKVIDRRTKRYKQARKVVEWAVARFRPVHAIDERMRMVSDLMRRANDSTPVTSWTDGVRNLRDLTKE